MDFFYGRVLEYSNGWKLEGRMMMEKLTIASPIPGSGAGNADPGCRRKTAPGFPANKLSRLLFNKQGNVAIIFALALLPTLAAIGAAVDITRALQVKARLNSALDAAGLAAGKKIDASDAVIIETANAYFQANYPADALGVPGALSVNITDDKIQLSVTANVETTIMKIMGFNDIDVSSTNEISREVTGLEIALALDNTGSMAGTKLANLKTASHELINILFGNDNSPLHLKMSLVPFAAGVNVGPLFDPAWLDMAGQSSIHSENFTAGTNLWTLYDNITNRNWNGCVIERPNGLDEQDVPPTAGNPDTFFVPWFVPDEPDGSNPTYPNSYLPDGGFSSSTSKADRQKSTVKYPASGVAISSSISASKGPNHNCKDTQTITPLTNDKLLLESRIDAMVAAHLTHIPIGLAWGWRTLSPEAPYTEGELYTDQNNIKALVLMTDGENTISGTSNHNLSTFTGYGYLSKAAAHYGDPSINTQSEAENELDAKTTRMCNKIKAAGIRVYTIAFQVTAPTTLSLLQSCANSPDQFFASSSGAALSEAFKTIATELASLRLSK